MGEIPYSPLDGFRLSPLRSPAGCWLSVRSSRYKKYRPLPWSDSRYHPASPLGNRNTRAVLTRGMGRTLSQIHPSYPMHPFQYIVFIVLIIVFYNYNIVFSQIIPLFLVRLHRWVFRQRSLHLQRRPRIHSRILLRTGMSLCTHQVLYLYSYIHPSEDMFVYHHLCYPPE